MSPLMMCLVFMLPLLTTATNFSKERDLYTLFRSDHVGDVLNVTQCYCESEPPNALFGYYYLFHYWNYHSNRTYSISVNCTTFQNQLTMKTADCIDRIDKVKKRCTDPDGNKFCFEFREDHDNVNHTKPSESTYWFNAQKRGVPAQPSRVLPLNNVTQNCEFYCSEKLPGLFTSKEPDWSVPHPVDMVANNIVSYEDLDDMCFNCA